jgi:hypothetical protein
MLSRSFLKSIKLKALRKGLWFKVLNKGERGLMDLTSQLVNIVRSNTLEKKLVKIIVKIRNDGKRSFESFMEDYGFRKAKQVSLMTVNLGYLKAEEWSIDLDFARYLTMIAYNQLND